MSARRGFAHCYACDFSWTAPRSDPLVLAILYEHVVQEVERVGGAFTISMIWQRAMARPLDSGEEWHEVHPGSWRRWGDGPSLYSITRHVVHDLAAHGIVQCVRPAGYRCLGWEVVRPT